MSSYREWAVHPRTKQIEKADYLDDYFGWHNYGVRFHDGSVWPIEQVPRMSEADRLAREAVEGREPEAFGYSSPEEEAAALDVADQLPSDCQRSD
jgi:hypothetical protein